MPHRPDEPVPDDLAPALRAAAARTWRRWLEAIDRAQQQHRATAFVWAVLRKFSDDRASRLAAVMTLFGFVSMFPLLLLLVTLLGLFPGGSGGLRDAVLDSAAGHVPVVGSDIAGSVQELSGSSTALVIGALGALWSGLRAMAATREALNEIRGVPRSRRPNFVAARIKGVSMLVVLGVGLVAAVAVNNVASQLDGIPLVGRLALLAGSLVVNVAVVTAAFVVLVDDRVRVRDVWPGALVGGGAYWALQSAGTTLVRYVVSDAHATYGGFAAVFAVLTWFYLQTNVTLLAAEVNSVLQEQLWPRSLHEDLHPTAADLRAPVACRHRPSAARSGSQTGSSPHPSRS